MDKFKGVLMRIVFVLIIFAIFLVPSKLNKQNEEPETASSVAETTAVTEATEAEDAQPEPKGTGLRIGKSNMIILAILGVAVAVNKIKEKEAERIREED